VDMWSKLMGSHGRLSLLNGDPAGHSIFHNQHYIFKQIYSYHKHKTLRQRGMRRLKITPKRKKI